MKTILKILFAPLLWMLQGCSPLGDPIDIEKSDSHYYNKSNNGIIYSSMGNWFELGKTEMKADMESFKVFNKHLSRDKNHIFINAYAVENKNIDLTSFTVKDGDYMQFIGFDKNHVYAFSSDIKNGAYEGTAKIIEGANPNTYVQTDWRWANDGNSHFYQGNRINADFKSFKPISDYFAKDSGGLFVRDDSTFKPLTGHLDSFQLFEDTPHGIDNQNIYWLSFNSENDPSPITIPYENREEINYLNRYFLKIKDTIYFDGIANNDIDTKTFEIIDHSYSKDAAHVYFQDKIVAHADPKSFKRMDDSYKYEDAKGIFDEGKLIEKKSGSTE